jgi:hypothetical protein
MKRKLSVAIALIGDSKVVILDEVRVWWGPIVCVTVRPLCALRHHT